MPLEIRLYGDLAQYGEAHDLDVHTPLEAIRAIDTNNPGFIRALEEGQYVVVAFPRGQEITDESQVEVMDLDRCQLPISHKQAMHILPMPEGEIDPITGFIASLIYAGGATGITLMTAETIAAVIVAVGVTLVLVGVSRLLMPAPPGVDETQAGESYHFGGPVNQARQGACVPVLFGGPLLIGSQVISQAIIAEDEDDPNVRLLKSSARAEIIDAISEGPIRGFVNADLESSIFLDGTPYKEGGKELFEGMDAGYRTGTLNQNVANINALTLRNSSSVTPVNIVIRSTSAGLIRTTSDPNVGKVKVTLKTGRFGVTQGDGDLDPITVVMKISIKGTGEGSYTEAKTVTFTGQAVDAYYRTVGINLSGFAGTAPYDIKVEKVTPDRGYKAKFSDDITWASFTEEVIANCSYPHTALVATQFDAEKFSSIPTRGFLMYGLEVRIPSNYDPINRTYDGAWDGTYKNNPAWTNNPAWIYLELCTNERWGLGRYMDDTLIDKWQLYSISQYCDEDVDDGYGGTEPRFACNLYLQSKAEAFTVLKDLASAFRSIMFWSDGQLRLQQDTPEAVSIQFAPANVADGEFIYSGTPKHTRFTVALVSWVNPEDNYSTWIEYVEDEAGIQLYGVNEVSLTAVGCTSRGQARRTGKYALLTSRLQTDAISFKTGLDAQAAIPGRVAKIVDPLHNQSDESVAGRMASYTDTTHVVLDRPVVLEAAHTYHITFTLPDGSNSSHQITNAAGTVTPPTEIAFVGAPLAQTPVDGAIWTITDDAESERLYRIMSVDESQTGEGHFYAVTGIRYDGSVLTDADDPGKLDPPDVPPINPGLSAPSALTLSQGVLPIGSSFRRYIDAVWQPPAEGITTKYEIEIIDSSKQSKISVLTSEYRLYDVTPGIYTFTVRAINAAGQISAGVSASITVEELAPIDLISITGLELKGQGLDTLFTGPDAEFEWRLTSSISGELGDETFGGDTGITDPWFRDYEVTVYDQYGTVVRVDHTTDRSYVYTLGKNTDDGGPRRTFEVGVAARDVFNRTTQQAYLQVTNPPPVGYTDVTLSYGIELITIGFTPPPDPDFIRTRVYVSQLSGFDPAPVDLAYEGDDVTVTISNLTEEHYYIKLEGVDEFGPAEIYSQQYSIQIQSVSRIHDQIAGEIQESWLYQSLNDRINLIDEPVSGLVDRVGANEVAIESFSDSGITAIHTYYQPTDPQDDFDPPTLQVGDLWINTSSGDTILRWNGSAWDALSAGGNKVFYREGPPNAPLDGPAPDPNDLIAGDYWIDKYDHDTDGNPDNVPYIWTGSQWLNARDGLLLSHATQIDYLEATIENPLTGTSGLAVYLNSVQAELFDAGGQVQSNLTTINYLGTEISDPLNGVSGMANYLNQVDLEVFDNSGQVQTNATAIEQLGTEVSYKITTYRQASEPTSPNDGDIWYNTTLNNKPFRYHASGTVWESVQDTGSTGTTTYIDSGLPTDGDPQYSSGDLYYDSSDNMHPYRYNGSTWDDIRDTSSTGIKTYYQTTAPSSGMSVGDVWFDSDDSSKAYVYQVSGWEPAIDADLGPTTYIDAGVPNDNPSIYKEGDLYFDSSSNNHPYRFDGANWQEITQESGINTYAASGTPADNPIVYSAGDLYFDTGDDYKPYRFSGTVWQEITDGTAGISTYVGTNIPPNDQTTYKEGDLFFDTDDANRLYRFSGASWDDVRDTSSTGATTYLGAGTPVAGPPYSNGDLYFNTSDDNHPYHYNGSAWIDIQDGSATGLQTYYQDSEPSAGMSLGDLWFDTDNNYKPHRYNGSFDGWVDISDGTVLHGVTPYIQPNAPAGPGLTPGDLWLDSDDDDKPYEWDGNSWEPILDDGTVTITAATAVERHARIQSDGLAFAEYTIKVDVNGHIAGIGLGVSGGASGPIRSEIIMLADRFAIGFPTTPWEPSYNYALGDWVTPTQAWVDANGIDTPDEDGTIVKRWPYVYEVTADNGTSSTSEPSWWSTVGVNGWNGGVRFTCREPADTLPFVTGNVITNLGSGQAPITKQGIVIDAAMIGQAAIESAHILDATITNAKISDLSADKLSAGTISVAPAGIKLGSPNFTLRSDTRRLTVSDDQGTPVDRVELGGLSTGGYGIIIRDGSGGIMLRSADDIYADELNGTYIKNATIRSASIENELNSSNWNGSNVGFQLKVNGSGAGSATFNELTIKNSSGEVLLHSGSSVGDFSKAGSGINIIDGDYSNFQANTSFINQMYASGGTIQISTEQSKFSSKSLKVTLTSSYAFVYLGVSSSDHNMDMAPNSEWIASLYVRAASPGLVRMYLGNSSGNFQVFSYNNPSANSWNRMSGVRDLSAYSQGNGLVFMQVFGSAGDAIYLDGIMLEQRIGSGSNPSGYYAKYGTRKHPDWLTQPVVNPDNPITSSNVGTYISSAAIDSAHIGSLTVDKLSGDIMEMVIKDIPQKAWGPSQTAENVWKGWHTAVYRLTIPQEPFNRDLSFENIVLKFDIKVKTNNITQQQITLFYEWQVTLNGAVKRKGSTSYNFSYVPTGGTIKSRSINYNEAGINLSANTNYDVRIQMRSRFTSSNSNESCDLTNIRKAADGVKFYVTKRSNDSIVWIEPP